MLVMLSGHSVCAVLPPLLWTWDLDVSVILHGSLCLNLWCMSDCGGSCLSDLYWWFSLVSNGRSLPKLQFPVLDAWPEQCC
jgi:hypothetical protein